MTRYSFGQRAVDRITRAVLKSEKSPGSAGGGIGGARNWQPGLLDAIVTTAITQASGTTYGTGAVQIYIDNGSGAGVTDPAYPSPVAVLNWYTTSGTIATGKHAFIAWRNAGWRLIVWEC